MQSQPSAHTIGGLCGDGCGRALTFSRLVWLWDLYLNLSM